MAIASGFFNEKLRAEAVGARARELNFKADEVDEFFTIVERTVQTVVGK